MVRTVLAALALALAANPATATDLVAPAPQGGHVVHSGNLPACNAPSVLNYITRRFGWAQRHTWKTDLAIQGIDMVEETDARLYGPSLIDRVYCRGRANLSDGREQPVFYLIESKMGFASHGSHVTFCLPEFDSYRVYDAWCRTVQAQ